MKRIFKKMTVSLMSALIIFSSTYATLSSASASDDIAPKPGLYIYGDVNDDKIVDIRDAVLTAQWLTEFKNAKAEATRMLLEYVKAQIGEFYLCVPQAADIDGDDYITNDDSLYIQ